ncbi:hypothetical protein [Bradyrhizobium lablabi]|uniref:hypothetical protein n=1 Tax=Bradyrhizobium lablabi TaxID=722472 RepID=UPI001BACAF88|nr:hypothetical protein [Bradyrhizobium lablabi]MBR0697430.1 hypothetical protein [Bradyrhizobium lablabi]
MALHRDIHWLGRQWAVTGHGLQLIDQRLKGDFDIEIARLWETDLVPTMHAKVWLNKPDFDKALDVARARFAKAAPGAGPETAAVAPPPPSTPTADELLAKLKRTPVPVAQGKPFSPAFNGKIAGSARFVHPWRAKLTRWHRNLPGLPPRS